MIFNMAFYARWSLFTHFRPRDQSMTYETEKVYSIQGSNAESANGTVAQMSGGAHQQRMMSVTLSSNSRNHDFVCFFKLPFLY